MDQCCTGPLSRFIIITAVLKLCTCLNDQISILRSLTTNKPIYLEHETAEISAKFQFPMNKSMSDYIFLWSVGHPVWDTPFIEETRYIYKHGNIRDVDRFEISFTSHSSGTGSIKIALHDLKLKDQRQIKLSVFTRDPEAEIMHELIEVRVDPQGATTSTAQVPPGTGTDTANSTLPTTMTTTPLRNTKMWIPLGFIFFLILMLICLKLYNDVNQMKQNKRETKSVNSSVTCTSKIDMAVSTN